MGRIPRSLTWSVRFRPFALRRVSRSTRVSNGATRRRTVFVTCRGGSANVVETCGALGCCHSVHRDVVLCS